MCVDCWGKMEQNNPCSLWLQASGQAEDPWSFEVFWVGRNIPGRCGAVQGCSHTAPEGKSYREGRGSSVQTLLCLKDITIVSLPFSKESPLLHHL